MRDLVRPDHRSFEKLLPFIAAFIDHSADYGKRITTTMIHTDYGEIVADMMGETGQRACGEEDLSCPGRSVKKIKNMFVNTFV